jgi:hypothetical protein
MGVLKFPRFLGGARRPEFEADVALKPDAEMQAIVGVGEWLATLETEEQKLRVLTLHMWRLKSGDTQKIDDWVTSIAEQSTMIVSKRNGFKEGVE